ncbi:MAG: DUF5615 family PIN-like protein [Candidatus Competibacteraceae bacterium]
MKLVADENVDKPIVDRLREDGHHVVAIAELEPGIPDEEVLSISTGQDAILITADTDFGELVFRQGLNSAGVVLIRLAGFSSENKATVVSRAIVNHGQEFSESFSVIGPTTVRIRRRRV